MRSVDRGEMPDTLKQDSREWTKDLLDALEKGDRKAIKRAKKRARKRYKHQEIRETLEDMYGELCCYCETLIGVASFEHIEHRRPMSKFPQDTFSWNNLHWACQICNNSKGDKWDCDNPILDPTVDTEIIPTHIDIVHGLQTTEFHHKTDSGKTTIEHACLNRPKLAKARHRLYNEALRLKRDLEAKGKSLSDMQKIKNDIKEINEMKTGMYGSCIKRVFEQFQSKEIP